MTESCVLCGGPLELALDLGHMPLVDGLYDSAEAARQAPRHPLRLCRCRACALVQLDATPPRDVLFPPDYPYASSVSSGLLASARAHAGQLIRDRRLGRDSLVVEAACNDGYQLRWFAEAGIPTQGIEPVPALAARCRALGVPCDAAFFDAAWAAQWTPGQGAVDVFLGKNVLAHVADPVDFLRGVARLLAPEGIACFEFPYLGNLIAHGQFDTIYHEHRCYLSVTSVQALLDAAGLCVQRIETIPLHGGSLRVTAGHRADACEDLRRWLACEHDRALNTLPALDALQTSFARLRTRLPEAVAALRAEGRNVAAYAAAAKGVVMLEACGLGCAEIAFVVDRNPAKQGRHLPGSGLPIVGETRLAEADMVLLLAWNHADEIFHEQRAYTRGGGGWIIPLPELRVMAPRRS